MTIKIYADGADLRTMAALAGDPRRVAGFTTNPSLARKAGVRDYREFCARALEVAAGLPVSLEVLADDLGNMYRQAHELAALGPQAVVKIPAMTSSGHSTYSVVRALATDGVPLNVTAVFTLDQIVNMGSALVASTTLKIVSVFAGRIADAGVDPLTHVSQCRQVLNKACPHAELLWASTRQVYDLTLAEKAGCSIITMTPDLIGKLALRGKDLTEYSRETVAMFAHDAREAGFEL